MTRRKAILPKNCSKTKRKSQMH